MKIYRNDSSAVNGANVWHAPKSNSSNIQLNADIVSKHRPDLDPRGAKFRVPSFSSLQDITAGKSIPIDVIKDRVAVLLQRMAVERKLKSNAAIPKLIARIFPAKGGMDEIAFNEILDTRNRSIIYESVLDAQTQVKRGDMPGIKQALDEAAVMSAAAATDEQALKAVFGEHHLRAAEIYQGITQKLMELSSDIAGKITVDYNRDGVEIGEAGSALFARQTIHLMGAVASQGNAAETRFTLIHEAAHLVANNIDDIFYYNTAGYKSLPGEMRIRNAAHFEEIPRKKKEEKDKAERDKKAQGGKKNGPPKPGDRKTVAPETEPAPAPVKVPDVNDDLRTAATVAIKRCWTTALNVFAVMRYIKRQQLEKNNAPFERNKGNLRSYSIELNLTMHEQQPDQMAITNLDLTLMEGIAHAFHLVKTRVYNMEFDKDAGYSEIEMVEKAIVQQLNHQQLLFADGEKNRKVFRWLYDNIYNIPIRIVK
ncbi:hypothetical protein SAMN05444266_10947 [Chitinophaga jiangningensis]|uniref:Uncharacterized protein n=1 Tax=Chitinophaga jiangningensis TaxID=1419482 RepID=A0A1M7JW52_9BACT|nr:hypothetical protein [Chitinophaga jiangningensis]SHM57249.1 hypothetical protein SAMN05444266_10947 [Chitinophaga jiangningensis]